MKTEFKTLNFECKALPEVEDDQFFYFEGYLSTYGNFDRGDDMFVKGCFDESLKNLTPDLLWMHKGSEPIGIFTELRSDKKGLFVAGKMPKSDSLVSGRVIPQMKIGSVRSMSVGYWAQEFDLDENHKRVISKAMLVEGSLVSQPMNPEAQVTGMKSLNIEDVQEVKTKRDFEKLLRDSGAFSKKAIVCLASRFKEDEPIQSDSEEVKSFVNQLNILTERIKGL